MQKYIPVWMIQKDRSLYDSTKNSRKYIWKFGAQSHSQFGPWKLKADLCFNIINSFLVYSRFSALGILERLTKMKTCQVSVYMK